MINKKAYYIWLGEKPKPDIFYKCYNSWKLYLKDYEIIEINEKNIDIEKYKKENKFFRQCYDKKMWAYCSDYIRTKILYENGGIYLDIDMELLKSIDEYLKYDFFIAYESDKYLGVGLFGAREKSPILKSILNFYNKEIYEKNLWTIPHIYTYVIISKEYDKKENVKLLPPVYFYPFGLNEKFHKSCIKDETVAIHWWNASWANLSTKLFVETKHLKGIKKIIKKIRIVLRFYLKGY